MPDEEKEYSAEHPLVINTRSPVSERSAIDAESSGTGDHFNTALYAILLPFRL